MQPTPSPDTPHAAPPDSLWAGLRDAIRGTGADYTRIPLRRAVFLLAVPMVLELVLESTPWWTSSSWPSWGRRRWPRWG